MPVVQATADAETIPRASGKASSPFTSRFQNELENFKRSWKPGRDYITDTMTNKFCPYEFDLVITGKTGGQWSAYWLGGAYYTGTYAQCVTFCTR